MGNSSEWQPATTVPIGVVVMTKIDDEKGVRNEQALIRIGGLWQFPDGSMHVYYIPTHWRPCTAQEQSAVRAQLQILADRARGRMENVRF